MAYEFRPARYDELDELVELLGLVFNCSQEWFRSIITNDPWRSPDNTRIALCGDRIVANVQVHRRPIHYGRARLVMGGIGHVATHPDHRKQGLSTRLLRDAIGVMERGGYHLSLLYTGINAFYAKLGWRDFPVTYYSIRLPLGRKLGPGTYEIRHAAIPEGLHAAMPIYHRCADYWVGMLDRTFEYWRANPSWTRDEFITEDPGASAYAICDGRPVAYLRGRIANTPPSRCGVDELCWLPGHEDATLDLLDSFIAAAQASPKESVELPIGEAHPALAALGRVAELQEHVSTSAQFRVIDPVGLLAAAAPELEKRLLRAGRGRLAPLTVDCEIGAAEVAADGGVTAGPASGEADVSLPEEDFILLVLGQATAEELSARGALAWRGTDRTEDLAALFPKRPYHYVRYDKF